MTAQFDSPALFTRWTGDVLGRGELDLVPVLVVQTFNSALSDRCSWSRWQARSPGGTGLTWLDSARLQVFRFRNNRMAETWTLGANPGVTWDGDA
ncbi:MAG: hypothetical protein IT301_17040 [Dehalococcoidia bacterium]|nr:hypothetical protein [Dehalococcoidia bacterium]